MKYFYLISSICFFGCINNNVLIPNTKTYFFSFGNRVLKMNLPEINNSLTAPDFSDYNSEIKIYNTYQIINKKDTCFLRVNYAMNKIDTSVESDSSIFKYLYQRLSDFDRIGANFKSEKFKLSGEDYYLVKYNRGFRAFGRINKHPFEILLQYSNDSILNNMIINSIQIVETEIVPPMLR